MKNLFTENENKLFEQGLKEKESLNLIQMVESYTSWTSKKVEFVKTVRI